MREVAFHSEITQKDVTHWPEENLNYEHDREDCVGRLLCARKAQCISYRFSSHTTHHVISNHFFLRRQRIRMEEKHNRMARMMKAVERSQIENYIIIICVTGCNRNNDAQL